MQMEFSYGEGRYLEGSRAFKGKIILSEHKLYLKGPEGEIPQTFIPLEKIERVRLTFAGLSLHVRPSAATGYSALLKARRNHLLELASDLAKRLNLRKTFLKREWTGEVAWK